MSDFKQELISAIYRASPVPVLSVGAFSVTEWLLKTLIALLTIAYLVFQISYLRWKWKRDRKAAGEP